LVVVVGLNRYSLMAVGEVAAKINLEAMAASPSVSAMSSTIEKK
jgi:hypothetical protein